MVNIPGIADYNQFTRRSHRQHLEHDRIYQAKNGRVRADAEGQCHYRNGGKGRTLPQHAQGVLQVLK
jgi:hypothetical protein